MAHKKGVGSSKNGRESDTLSALVDGTVVFTRKKNDRSYVSIQAEA